MALARIKTWIAGEVLTASDLNAEFNNVLNNANSLISPWTANVSAGGFSLITLSAGTVNSPSLSPTGDTNTGVYFPAADQVALAAGGVQILVASAYVNAVNSFRMVPSQTGAVLDGVRLETTSGIDSNVPMVLAAAGTGYVGFGHDGTAASPALAWTTDPTTGLYRAGASQVALTAGGRQVGLFRKGGAAAVNYPDFIASVSGSGVTFAASGADPAVNILIQPQSTNGNVVLQPGGTATLTATGNVSVDLGTQIPLIPGAAPAGTPQKHGLYQENVPKAWVSMSGTTAAINDSFNVSSTSDDGTGLFTITFSRAFATHPNYTVHATGSAQRSIVSVMRSAAGNVQIGIDNGAGFVDIATVYAVCFGDQ